MACGSYTKKNWNKRNIRQSRGHTLRKYRKKIPKAEYMSTDEECDNGFISHSPYWQRDTFARIKKNLDSTYLEISSTKSKRLLQKRSVGSISDKEVPKYTEDCFWLADEFMSLLVFYVTCNDISVIYVTAQMCRRTEEVVPKVGLPTP